MSGCVGPRKRSGSEPILGIERRNVVLLAMTVANGMTLVDQTAVPLALPNIMHDFGVGSESAQWVLSASLLPLAGLLVLGGRLGDLLGRRRIFLIGCLAFAGASALGGAAPAFAVLLACRVVQGMGGALMLPNTVAIVSATFSPEERGRALGTMGGLAAVAGALGPTIGGALTGAFSWRAVLLSTCRWPPSPSTRRYGRCRPTRPGTRRAHVDVRGATRTDDARPRSRSTRLRMDTRRRV